MKILIIDWLYIGDLVFATPFIRQLRNAFPEAEIDIMVQEQNKAVFLYNPNLNHVIGVNRTSFQGNPLKNIKMIQSIRRKKYDMVINMQPHERTTIFSAFSGAKIKAGRAHKGPLQLFFTHPIPEDTSDLKHTAEKYFEFLDALEIPRSTHNGYEVFIDEKSAAQAEKLWHQAGLDDQTVAVGIHVGSIWATKRWTMVGFIELAKLMCNNGLTPVFFGGPQDVEAVAAIVQAIPCKTAVFTGKTTLLEFTYLAGKCRAFVSNDSGPAHLAASRETPVAMIFGPTLPQRYAPIYSRHIVLQSNEPCLGCGKKVCTDHRCMKNLSAEKVFEAVLDLIKPFSNNVP